MMIRRQFCKTFLHQCTLLNLTTMHTRGYNSVVVGDNPKESYEKDGAICDHNRINGKDHLVPTEPQPLYGISEEGIAVLL